MKYLVIIALLMSCLVISCDEEMEKLPQNTPSSLHLKTYDKGAIETILNQVNSPARYQDLSYWEAWNPLYYVEGLSGEPELDPQDPKCAGLSGGDCGECPGFCTRGTNVLGKSVVSGNSNSSGVISQVNYNNGYRLYSFTLVRHRQTGVEKIMFDFTDRDYFLRNGNLHIPKDVLLNDQMTRTLQKQSITLKAGIYPTVVDPTTRHPQTIVDAIIR